jgi:murein DD-endopeptidase MepM/ murein hydrolase activator NlpD
VTQLAQDLAVAEEQYERVRRLLGVTDGGRTEDVSLPPLRGDIQATRSDTDSPRPSSWPLTQTGVITQRRVAGDDGTEHPGLDIAVAADSYIRASGPGTVKAAGIDAVYGRYILIDHGGGLESMYGHASRLFVAAGDEVERNEVIALSGSTGRSTAPHLHFEIRRDGQAVDPLLFVRQPS